MLDIDLERSAEERELAKEKQLEAEFGQLLEVILEFVRCKKMLARQRGVRLEYDGTAFVDSLAT